MPKKQYLELLLIPVLFFLIYFQVFVSDYAYSDDIHGLWHNHDGFNFTFVVAQGRLLTGLLTSKIAAALSTVPDLRYMRIAALIGWIITVYLWRFIFSSWVRRFDLDKRMTLLMTFYVVCCIPVTIFIGWASCMERFTGVIAGLLSGHLLLKSVIEKTNSRSNSAFLVICSLVLGVVSLFIHQSTFGVFLLPFFIYYLRKQPEVPVKTIITSIAFYLLVYIIYYILFRLSLKIEDIKASSRVGISTDIGGKFSFLFSDPLPAAFSVNILYTARSIFSQIFAPLMMISWVISVFIRNKKRKISGTFFHIISVFAFLVLMYIPNMIAPENFSSYRTLFVLNLAVFYLLADQVFFFLKKERGKTIFIYSACFFLLLTGLYNYNFQLVNPLKSEKKAFDSFMSAHLKSDLQTVYFIRADKFMFTPFFHTLPYKDEFGLPSTNKDWVPEPLVKQYVLESTGSRSIAEKINVVQFADTSEYNNVKVQLSGNDILIDMNKVFTDYLTAKK